MRYVRLKVMRDTNTVYNVAVVPWEQPVLEALFPTGSVQETGEFAKVVKDPELAYPEAGLEFDRLMRKYGADPGTGIPHVVNAYGSERAGIRALGEEIARAKKADLEAGEGSRRGRRARAEAADPLTA